MPTARSASNHLAITLKPMDEAMDVKAFYLPAWKPFRHPLDHILRIRSDDPHPLYRVLRAASSCLRLDALLLIQPIGRNQDPQSSQRSQQFRPLARPLLARV